MSREMREQVIWSPQPGPQTALLQCPVFEIFFGGARGGGKGLPAGAPVLTPFGWRAIGDLTVGSKVCATDGPVTEVIGVYHRDKQRTYRLTWSDGVETICDADHIWLAWTSSKSRKIGGKRTSGEASAKKWTTAQIFDHYRKQTIVKRRIAIPVISAPVAFNVSNQNAGRYVQIGRTVHPYVIGVLLGDGSIGKGDANFTSGDVEIADRVERCVGFKVFRYVYPDKCPSYRIPRAAIVSDLVKLGMMGCRAEDKSIPRIYMLGSPQARWELLRGLMDTDGWADADGDCYFCSVSQPLAVDVAELARSLGAIRSGDLPRAPGSCQQGDYPSRTDWRLDIDMCEPRPTNHLATRKFCSKDLGHLIRLQSRLTQRRLAW
jgi:phosphate starvation-inducible PhoH-like protein